ncbi:hypothetical protein PLEOSDRAFT_166061 [Pleurotus ostreatus PC15]|uniref:Uncharacterized protein n=1 Tax=Pleurotus ostreatus (strain PC15) TaxID=1137138 RepID=A0A067NR99_PLEO1|nr:hypothetical protein PLEOSDRAFT_166061 [Pleurotus ostreatus PC15]
MTTPSERRAMLLKALDYAHEAVNLDTTKDGRGAVVAYRKCTALLDEVIVAAAPLDEKSTTKQSLSDVRHWVFLFIISMTLANDLRLAERRPRRGGFNRTFLITMHDGFEMEAFGHPDLQPSNNTECCNKLHHQALSDPVAMFIYRLFDQASAPWEVAFELEDLRKMQELSVKLQLADENYEGCPGFETETWVSNEHYEIAVALAELLKLRLLTEVPGEVRARTEANWFLNDIDEEHYM